MRASVFASLVLAVAALAPPPADACGPDFPASLLADRGHTLGSLPEGTFLTEVAHLVEPAHPYTYVAGDEGQSDTSVRAAYLRGRDTDNLDRGIAAYQRVRVLVDVGFDDGAGLALSSLGQEARLQLHRGDTVRALHLYAEQAALGHPDGGTSLLLVVRDLVLMRREATILGDPLGQRLLAIYLATRGGELHDDQAERLWDELGAIDHLAGADQLAAVAYQRGDWDRATALVAQAGDTPLAHWVGAKLALRAGDRAGSDRLLALAADGFRVRAACPEGGDRPSWIEVTPDAREDLAMADYTAGGDEPAEWCGSPEQDRILAERYTVAVGEGRMTDALALTWQTRQVHPDDLTYVAERLVTVDELRAFVDQLPHDGADDDDTWGVTTGTLRELLGRRLMRAGRYREAVPYLGFENRGPAIDFAVAMDAATVAHDPIDRARALFQASRVARASGLEFLGTANAPDWEQYDAQYDLSEYTPGPWADAGSFLELVRFTESAPIRPERYHYRFLASDLAEQAASLLPRRSQAQVATLCWAARHIRHVDQARMQDLYWRATHQQPAIDDMDFPSWCPLPEFDRARRFLRPPTSTPARVLHAVFGHGPAARRRMIAVAALVGGLTLLAMGLAARRRWRRFTPRP